MVRWKSSVQPQRVNFGCAKPAIRRGPPAVEQPLTVRLQRHLRFAEWYAFSASFRGPCSAAAALRACGGVRGLVQPPLA